MSVSPGLSKQTNDNLRYGPSSDVDNDSPFGINSGVKNYIPGQKTPTTPETELNESFISSPGGSLPIPSSIFCQDVPSRSSDTETILFPSPSSEPIIWVNKLNDNNNNNDKKRKAETPSSTSNKSSVKYTSNVFDGLHDQLDVGLGIPVTATEQQKQAQLYQKVVDLLKEEDCPHCFDIKCTIKIPNAFALALGKKVGFFEDRIHKDSWRDMYNNR
jgi:hypothetical protein